MELLKEIPSLYCYYRLYTGRDKQLHRKIQKNDLNDIHAFAMAIPYCDIIIGEKMFTKIAKDQKLDELYQTKILTDIEELIELI